MNKEPLITAGAIVAAGGAIIGLLVAFGVPITEEQRDAIQNFLTILGPIVLGALVTLAARPAVTPNAKVAAVRENSGELVAGDAAAQPNGAPVIVSEAARRVDLDPPA